MLVLTRRDKESVVVGRPGNIGQLVKVTVLEIQSQHVRLGFEADALVPVHRWEVWQRIHGGALPGHPTEGPPPIEPHPRPVATFATTGSRTPLND